MHRDLRTGSGFKLPPSLIVLGLSLSLWEMGGSTALSSEGEQMSRVLPRHPPIETPLVWVSVMQRRCLGEG